MPSKATSSKTMKKSVVHSYKYPQEFLTKKGTLKKNLSKKINEWRSTHNYDGSLVSSQKKDTSSSSSEDVSDSVFKKMHNPLEKHEQKDYLVDKNAVRKYKNTLSKKMDNFSSSESQQSDMDSFLRGIKSDSIEDLGSDTIHFNDLGADIHEKILDQYVFNDKGRILTHENCKRMRDYCELNPRKCYLEKEFLEKYVRICQMIAKTSLYIDAFYDRTIDLDQYYLKNGPSNSQSWRKLVATRDYYSRQYSVDNIINKFIPKTQMPPDAKKILIDVIGNIPKLSGGIIKDDFLNYYTQASRSVLVFKNIMYTFVEELVKDKNLMENMVQMWREGMATLTDRKPKQIEEIIRRFIKNL
jgi:hypothetical protein|tara:strand:- start:6 stop:1073 length:1068 start_codon:yes stop_codon:yes gene_type:complete